MSWNGKIIGAIVGMLVTRNYLGVVLGMLAGHFFDHAVERGHRGRAASAAAVAEVFFRCTFELMGHVAKSDGRVSAAEIEAARLVMRNFRLNADQVAAAIECFRRGKADAFDADAALAQFLQACGAGHDLLYVFIELQVRAALAGNGLNPEARRALQRAAASIGISELEFARIVAVLRGQFQSQQTGHSAERPGNGLAADYRELDRRQMSRHHPDKLVARGLPESMAEFAKEKTQRVQKAYEAISAARGMR
jgi:DnaJ like chaperone protein